MSGNTTNEGYPYPLTADFSDVQDAFRLAASIDADLRAEQAPFRAFMGRPSFVGRQAANGGSTLAMTAVEWDNTGGITGGGSFWHQPIVEAPSWWLFGATILVAVTSGTPVVGDLNLGEIDVTTTDQVSGLSTTTSFYQRNDDTNTGGEWINLFAMAPVYQGIVSCVFTYSGTAVRVIGAGSRLWGMYLGPVI